MEKPEAPKRGKKTEQLTEILSPVDGSLPPGGDAGPSPLRPQAGSRFVRAMFAALLWVAVLASLAINVYLLRSLREARADRQALAGAITALAEEVKSAQAESFVYTVNITESVPVEVSITNSQKVEVPISMTVPYTSVVSVPYPGIAGAVFPPARVPISLTIPVSLTVEKIVTTTIPFSSVQQTVVHRDIEIPVSDTPLFQLLARLEETLRGIGAGAR